MLFTKGKSVVDVSKIASKTGIIRDPKPNYESVKESTKESAKESTKQSTKSKTSTKSTKNADAEICAATKASGEPCTFKAKENGYCGRHDPDKVKTSTGTKTAKTLKKKEVPVSCNATITKAGKKCTQMGTVKPDNANFHYCKRHSEKWVDFEQQESVDQLLYNEENETDNLPNETDNLPNETDE
jgi:hypothetical protein